MLNVKNRNVITRISRRTLKAGWLRNVIAVFAIALTAILFTSLFTIGGSMMKTIEEETMRQIGTRAHSAFKLVNQEEFDKLRQAPSIKDYSYNILIGIAENKGLEKVYTEIRYSEEKDARWGYCYPTTGTMPRQGMALATGTKFLDALGIPHEIGAKVPLKFTAQGKQYDETFTLCGFWESDPVSMAEQVWLSREYCDAVAPTPSESYYTSQGRDMSGYLNMSIMFYNSWDIAGKTDKVRQNAGFDKNDMQSGVNWAYNSSEVDATTLLLVLLVLLLIMLSGYLIIFNIFYISVSRDIRFYGLLKTIGATGTQIKRLVRSQAFLLALIGIPLGLAAGYLVGIKLVPFVMGLTYMKDLTTLSASPVIFIGAAIFALLTVYISCLKPCRIAAKVSPVEAVRYTEADVKKKKKKARGRVTTAKMAFSNITRSRKRGVAVILSLSLSMILLNSVYTVTTGFDMDTYLEDRTIADFNVGSSTIFNLGAREWDTAGITPAFLEDLRAQDGVTGIGIEYFRAATHTLSDAAYERGLNIIGNPDNLMPPFSDNAVQALRDKRQIETPLYGINEYMAGLLTDQDGKPLDWEKLATGDYTYVSGYIRNDITNLWYQPGETVTVTLADGVTKDYQVLGLIDLPHPATPRFSGYFDMQVVLPENEFFEAYGEEIQPLFSFFNVESGKVEQTEEWLKQYTTETDPSLGYESKLMFVTEFEELVNIFQIVGGMLALILALIGILNFINTVVTSILSRRRELAMLQSIGMTGGQLKSMLILEGFWYSALTFAFTVTLGSLISYAGITLIAGQLNFFTYHFTLLPLLLCVPALILVSILVPLTAYHSMCQSSIVDRLREAE